MIELLNYIGTILFYSINLIFYIAIGCFALAIPVISYVILFIFMMTLPSILIQFGININAANGISWITTIILAFISFYLQKYMMEIH